ncbi:MAG: HDOD domain-containing protein [Desulfonatronovibrio sp.]
MKRVCVEHLQPGMELYRDVPGADGSVFLAKGSLLSPDHIEWLADLGVGSVKIAYQDPEQYKQDLARRCEEYVHQFFYYVNPESPVFNQLYAETLQMTFDKLLLKEDWFLPCDQELRANIHQSKRDLFFKGEGGLEDIVNHEMELISVPDTYFKLQDILKNPDSSAKHVAEVVRLDVNLVAKLMRLVNSPLYRAYENVDSIERAVARIGVEGVSSLALGITAMPMFKDIPPDLIDVSTFWRHSISCAIFSQELAREIGLEGEQFFTAGLLHDVGRLLLLKNLPQASVQFLLYARGSMVPLVEAEEVILGYNHAQVGEKLLNEWGCPEKLVDLVSAHHSPGKTKRTKEAAIIQLADNMANAFAIASRGSYVLPGMEDEMWELLGLTRNVVAGIYRSHEKTLAEISKLLV